MRGKRIGIGIVLFGLVIAVVFGGVAFYSARAENAVNAVAFLPERAVFSVDGHGRGFGGVSDEDLAAALGITADELQTARQEAHTAVLTQAVEQGLITQTQADELQARGTAFPFGNRWNGWLSEMGIDYDSLLADALGISVADLRAAHTEAYQANIDQAVSDGELIQEQADLLTGRYALANSESFQTAMQASYQNAVEQAVSEGVISQAQADQILAEGNQMRFGVWGGFEGRGGRGFGGPGRHFDRDEIDGGLIAPPAP